MIVTITLTSTGADTGPFNLYSNVDGFVSAFEVSIPKASLLAGYTSYIVPDGTTVIRVMSANICTNYIDIFLKECYCYTVECITTGNVKIQWTSCDGTENNVTYRSLPGGIWGPYCCQKDSITVNARDPYTIYGGTEQCLIDDDCYSTTTTTTTSLIAPISCVTYSRGDEYAFEYDVDTNTSTQFFIPTNDLAQFGETHTSYKYWKGHLDSPPYIKEWTKLDNSGVLAFTRQIDISSGVFFVDRFIQLFAIDDNTLLTTAVTPGGTRLFRMDITNNPVTSADVTQLFPISTEGAGLESFFLTTTNKIIGIVRKNMSATNERGDAHLVQYNYLTGFIEVDINLTSVMGSNPVQVYTFSVNGKIYVSQQFPFPTSSIWEVQLNSPYTLTPIGTTLGLFGNVLNSKLSCNTVHLIPSITPTTTTTTTTVFSPINTIYTHFSTY